MQNYKRKKKIVFHIGLHKTGSTSIQDKMKESFGTVSKEGVFYPMISVNGEKYSNHSFMFYSMFCDAPEKYHMNQKFNYDTKEKVTELNGYYRESLVSRIKETNSDFIVFSGEDISSLTEENINSMKEFFIDNIGIDIEFEIVVYVRHLCDYVQSVIQQRVKDGGWEELLLAELKSNKIGQVQSQIEKFVRVFGLDSIKAYKFEDAISHSHGIVGHFFDQVLGLSDLSYFDFSEAHSNRSISYESYLIHSFINKKEPLYNQDSISDRRSPHDLHPLIFMKGAPFSLGQSFHNECYFKLFDDFKWLKDAFNIDYSPHSVEDIDNLWSEEVLVSLSDAVSKVPHYIKREIINVVRDQAIKYEKNDIGKSYSLMKWAIQHRSDGVFIKKIN
ncbi:hypothetical protein [Marinomonas sp. GJ51-6]|uniref:hypothetical protein n=1 Tax=Marinomonas sp. GJ51-6 TaxID=2992802 RepID=UPI00293496C3|nr:hypothetical protein [Marinomonas sp. GJ51-6]WOD06160.1 hypothetical protein ONZ50_10455 [Marinomonas sp. GJ51-6]